MKKIVLISICLAIFCFTSCAGKSDVSSVNGDTDAAPPAECTHSISSELTADVSKQTHFNTCEKGCGAIFNETACTINDATCTENSVCAVCGQLYAYAAHAFEGEVTYNRDATASSDGTVTGFCTACDGTVTVTLSGSSALISDAFKDVTVSLLGDSISTFINVSNGTAAETSNSTIENNSAWYKLDNKPSLNVGLDDTWWMQTINEFGARLLVNNSWSGSLIRHKDGNTNGTYDTRALQLHDDTGDNAGEEPDIIFVYMGTNDVNVHSSNIGSTEDIDFNNIGALRYKDRDSLTVLEAYVIMIDNIRTKYENAEIYCMNVLNCRTYYNNKNKYKALENFNVGARIISEHLGATYVDIYNKTGICEWNMEDFIPIYDDDTSDNNYHPNKDGMDLIADCVIEAVVNNSEYMPEYSEFLALIEQGK